MSIYEFSARTIDGEEKRLGDFAGKVLLIVNVASQCGLTPQYRGLQELYEYYGERGFEVLAFPCNQFGGQEPSSEEEIRAFCTARYRVTFPLFAKIEVNGPNRHPLYAYLTQQPTTPDGPGDIQWNFAKFLIDRQGRVVARYAPTTAPASEEVVDAIERTLG